MTTRQRQQAAANGQAVINRQNQEAAEGRRAAAPTADVFARTVPFLLERHGWGQHKKGSMARVETQANKALLTLTKRLIESPELRAITACDVAFRVYLQGAATPFRPNLYLVAIGMIEATDTRARQWERERGELADKAADVFPAQVALMPDLLKDQFNPLDYPSQERFRASFWVDWRFIDLGVPNLLREIRADVFERERAKLARIGQEATDLIQQHLRGTLLEITNHLSGLLAPKADGRWSTLREGSLDKLNEFLATVSLRDTTNDEELKRVVRRLRALGGGLDVEQLREDTDLRTRTAEVIAASKVALESLVVEKGRAIVLED